MSILLTITIALLITFVGARIAAYFKYPPILGQFASSLILAIPFVKETIFTQESVTVIETFAQLAIIFLLLLTGLGANINRIRQSEKESVLTALFSTATPFLSGILVGQLMGFSITTSVIIGIALSVTAEGTNIAVLLQMGKLKTRLGTILLSAGILDDVFEILFLSIVLVLAHQGGSRGLLLFPVKLAIFIAIMWVASLLIPKVLKHFERVGKEITTFNIVILITLVMAILSDVTGLSGLLGAFIAGLILQKSFLVKKDEKHEEHEMSTFLFGFIIPFFFINIALNFDPTIIFKNPLLVLIIILVAILSKIVGVLLTKPFVNLKWAQLYLIGWGMNSRGVMELIIVDIALQAGLISDRLFSAIIVMSVITTFIFPFFLRRLIKMQPEIMD